MFTLVILRVTFLSFSLLANSETRMFKKVLLWNKWVTDSSSVKKKNHPLISLVDDCQQWQQLLTTANTRGLIRGWKIQIIICWSLKVTCIITAQTSFCVFILRISRLWSQWTICKALVSWEQILRINVLFLFLLFFLFSLEEDLTGWNWKQRK